MTNPRAIPALALTIRGLIQHAPENWRAHMAAAADAVEECARLRAALESALPLSIAVQRACSQLPEGYEVVLRLELGAGSVYLEDRDGVVTSIDIMKRVDDPGREIRFDGVVVLSVPGELLNAVESYYIRREHPPYNIKDNDGE